MPSLTEYAKFNIAAYSKSNKNIAHWNYLIDSDILKLSNAGYYGTVFIKKSRKEVVIANSGTSFNFYNLPDLYNDMYSNYQIYKSVLPDQYKLGAKLFVEKLLESYSYLKDYTIYFTGHSLGATLAELQLAEFKKYDVSAVTFEGSDNAELLKKTFKNINLKDLDLNVYNVNEFNRTYGNVHKLSVNINENLMLNKVIAWLPKNNITEKLQNHYFANLVHRLEN